jgi:hypothetical protein
MARLIGAEVTAEVGRKLAEVRRSERPPIPPSASSASAPLPRAVAGLRETGEARMGRRRQSPIRVWTYRRRTPIGSRRWSTASTNWRWRWSASGASTASGCWCRTLAEAHHRCVLPDTGECRPLRQEVRHPDRGSGQRRAGSQNSSRSDGRRRSRKPPAERSLDADIPF